MDGRLMHDISRLEFAEGGDGELADDLQASTLTRTQLIMEWHARSIS
jgi:hypothetical protein